MKIIIIIIPFMFVTWLALAYQAAGAQNTQGPMPIYGGADGSGGCWPIETPSCRVTSSPGISGTPGAHGEVVLECGPLGSNTKLVNGECIPVGSCIDLDGAGKPCDGAGGAWSRSGTVTYNHPGDMSVANGRCYIMDSAHHWVPCGNVWSFRTSNDQPPFLVIDGGHAPCDPGYALLAYPGTWTLVCARDLQAPK